MRVLIADDNDANRLIARAILEREGHDVSLASNGPDAVDLARVRDFDAVLLDILMPGMDGLRTIRKLKSVSRRLPVFALTSYDSPADLARYREAGFDGTISKPLQPGDFDDVWRRLRGEAPADMIKAAIPANDHTAIPLLDLRVIEGGVGRASADVSPVVLRHFKASLTTLIQTLQQTLPGASRLDPADLSAFRDALHALKSATLMIGLLRAPEIAGMLRNAPPTELREGVVNLLRTLRQSLPELEAALAHDPDGASVALRQNRRGMQVSGEHQAEAAHDDEHDRAAIAHQR